MALTFYWGFEDSNSTLDSPDYSAGDTTADTESNFTYGAAAAKVGSVGAIGAASAAGNVGYRANTGILANGGDVDTAVGSCGYWWQAETGFPGNSQNHGFRAYYSVVGTSLRVQSVTGSKLTFTCANGLAEQTFCTPTAALSAGTWYFVVIRWDVPNNKMKMELYTDGGGGTLTPVTDGSLEITTGVNTVVNSADFGGSTFSFVQAVSRNSGYSGRTFFDNVIMCDTYDAPIEENAFITSYTEFVESSGTFVTPNPAALSV